MTYGRLTLRAGLLVAAAAMLGCGDSPGEVTAGLAVVSLASPFTDGAILVRLTGPGFGTPQVAGSGAVVHWRQVSETEIVVAVFGAVSTGTLFRVEVPNLRKIERYQATVLQVADRNDAERSDRSAHVVQVATAE